MFEKKKPEQVKKEKIKTSLITDLEKANMDYDKSKNDSDLVTAMYILASNQNLESNTILTNEQVNALTVMNWAGQVYDIEFFKYFISLFPKYRISGDKGQGRKDLIRIAEAIQKSRLEDKQNFYDIIKDR
jgi:hypothetical protein